MALENKVAIENEFATKAAAIAAVTPADVNAAMKKWLDPAKLSIVKAGDFKKP